ncbi:hypothetical protein [Lentzea flava]|uniref:Uncharacterized protein n=1 Tax=Lentzea flava TaxID=103732 RepID=A0ABQ2UL19_9PSEU|nr:hypothetical protein [Lentzea flava]GGU42890.1 hypothetical protein GCM10010178_39390 [Lentzea flava]
MAGLRETAALLGGAVDHACPAYLRPRVLEAVRFVKTPGTARKARFPESRYC